jgi:hypothetical protein
MEEAKSHHINNSGLQYLNVLVNAMVASRRTEEYILTLFLLLHASIIPRKPPEIYFCTRVNILNYAG